MSARPEVEVLLRLYEALDLYLVANDAEDRSSAEEAMRLRERAARTVLALLAEHRPLDDALPDLAAELAAAPRRQPRWQVWVEVERRLAAAGALAAHSVVHRRHENEPPFALVGSSYAERLGATGPTIVEGTLDGVEIGRAPLRQWDPARWVVTLTDEVCRLAAVDDGDEVVLRLRLPREGPSAADP